MNKVLVTNESNSTSCSNFDDKTLFNEQPWRLQVPEHKSRFEPFWFEQHDHLFWRQLVWENPHLPFFASVVYLVTIFGLQKLMRNRAPFRLKTPLILWNWALGVFSMVGFYRVGQEVFTLILEEEHGLHDSLCGRCGHYLPAAFWGLLFNFSKFVELGDTIFIALKKQPLITLHWFHHSLVVIFSWVLYSWQESVLRWYGLMNYGVHTLMYPYFALRGMNVNVPEIFAVSITTLQVAQMIAGVAFNVYTLYVWGKGESCSRNPYSVAFSLFTYLAFGVMFVQFFISKYVSRTRQKNKKE